MSQGTISGLPIEATSITEGSFLVADINIGTVLAPVYETQKVSDTTVKSSIAKPIESTYADAVTLLAASGLKVGSIYNLTDLGIYIIAVKSNAFSIQGSREMRIVKNSYYTASTGVLGVWKSTLTPSASDVVIWGGKVWTNDAGAVGTATNDASLSSDWTVIANTNATYYEDKSFFIIYNFGLNLIVEQRDDRANIVRGNIDITDWGNNIIYRNYSVYGIYNNANANHISDNTNFGSINANSNSGVISRNSNLGAIKDNTNDTDIYNNSNAGYIQNMSNSGSINNNSNNGNIQNITTLNDNVRFNINNGYIQTTTTGTISDTTVNK